MLHIEPPTPKQVEELNNEIKKSMKIAVDNRKKKEEQPEQIEVKKARIPKYIHIGGNKIMTPKEIVQFDYEGYLVFGDKRCQGCKLDKAMIDDAKKKGLVTILLRIPKRKTGDTFAFSQDLKTVMSYRKWRLANATNLFVIGQATDTPHQTIEQFISSEIVLDKGLGIEEMKELFLASEDPNLILKDVNRMIHLYYQESKDNENGVPNKNSADPK